MTEGSKKLGKSNGGSLIVNWKDLKTNDQPMSKLESGKTMHYYKNINVVALNGEDC